MDSKFLRYCGWCIKAKKILPIKQLFRKEYYIPKVLRWGDNENFQVRPEDIFKSIKD